MRVSFILIVSMLMSLSALVAVAEDAAKKDAPAKETKEADIATDCVTLSEEETKEGFVSLFDGKTIEGWTTNRPGGYVVRDGAIVCLKDLGRILYTDKEYGDFVFRFEFKLTPGANNGVGVRTPKKRDPAYDGMEIQILDNSAKQWKNLKPYQVHGSIYGVAPAKTGYLKPVGEWNTEEITCHGNQVTVKVNGVTIVDVDIAKISSPQTIDGNAHPGLKRKQGFIAFCGHGDEVEFRKIRLKEIE